MEQEGINLLPWPSKSPDLNPVEKVWGEMMKYLKRINRPENVEQILMNVFYFFFIMFIVIIKRIV
jgi:transposase